jgi:hypothetical protein
MSRVSTFVAALMLLAAPAFAQDTKPAQPQSAKDAEATRRAEEQRRVNEAQPVNTRLELTITDMRGDGAPTTKTVSLMTADRYWGRIRTQGDARNPAGGRVPVILNVDARPTLIRDGRARVELTIEYRPADDPAALVGRREGDSTTPNINESLAVILEDGKTVLISQSADPVTDRKVKIEAKFTIVR